MLLIKRYLFIGFYPSTVNSSRSYTFISRSFLKLRYVRTQLPDTPMRQMIRTFPDIAEKVFDKCIVPNLEK